QTLRRPAAACGRGPGPAQRPRSRLRRRTDREPGLALGRGGAALPPGLRAQHEPDDRHGHARPCGRLLRRPCGVPARRLARGRGHRADRRAGLGPAAEAGRGLKKMLRTTLAGLRLHTSRYVTTTLAILLGVTFVTGTTVLADTLESGCAASVMGSDAGVDTIAVPQAPEPVPDAEPRPPAVLCEQVLGRIQDLPEVAEADGRVEGQAVLLDSDDRAYG